MRIVGIDPGSRVMGWGIITEESGCARLIDCGIIKAANRASDPFSERLAYIYHELCLVLKRHHPDVAAIEQAFVSQNVQSALKLGHARGVAVAACAALGLEIYDYEPTLVKKSLVGVGRAEKEQVAFMVKRILNVPQASWALDASDALAVAICHLSQARFLALAAKARRAASA